MTTRAQILGLLGEPPIRGPLDLTVRSESAFQGGRRLLVDYAVDEEERIPAYLLIPEPGWTAPRPGTSLPALAAGLRNASATAPSSDTLFPPGNALRRTERYPGIIAVHRESAHYALGKSEPAGLSANAMYHYGVELCRRGYVVLCPDLLGFVDRRPPEHQRLEGRAPDGPEYERYVATRLLLEGTSLRAKNTFDLARGLDVLESLPMVDSERIGAIGHGLGGTEAFWLTWYDARVRALLCSCGLTTLRTLLRDQINQNLSLYLPGLLRLTDMDALAAGLSPCPMLLTAAEGDDRCPIDGVRQVVSAAQASYSRAGVPDQFRAILFPGERSFPPNVREESFRQLDRWLKGSSVAAQTLTVAGRIAAMEAPLAAVVGFGG